MKNIYQIKVSLKDVKPIIWRRILVASETKMRDFQKIIESTMGWLGGHLHQFIKNGEYFSVPYEDEDDFDAIDYRKLKLDFFLRKEKDKITYEYDFGDNWEHTIILEAILPVDKSIHYPVCIAGKNCCPPEDCGGADTYMEMLKIIDNPTHPEYEDTIEAMGFYTDPKHFDLEEINERIKAVFE